MTRKDSEKESERPHYYSQFWLDIAAGRRTIGGPKPEDEGELLDDAPEPISLRRPLRSEPDDDLEEEEQPQVARRTTSARTVTPVVSPVEDEVVEEPEEEELATPADAGEDFSEDELVADADIPDMDLAADEDVEDEEIFDDEEDEDEDEEEEGWVPGRGRKKPSPKRPTKQPPVKRPKRDSRRSF